MIGFGNFKKRETGIESLNCELIKSLQDKRLLKVKITENFFDQVLDCNLENEEIEAFIEAVREVKGAKIADFWVPIYDPSLIGENIVFIEGRKPAVEFSFNWWKNHVDVIPSVEGKKWKIGTEYQYYAFLVFLINGLIQIGWSLEKTMEAVVLDSKELGHYQNSKNAKKSLEPTGSRFVAGAYDLGNTIKLLYKNNESYWQAGGAYDSESYCYPLADLYLNHDVDFDNVNGVAWLILE